MLNKIFNNPLPTLKTGKDAPIGFRYNRWPSIIFLAGISLIAIIGCPLYLYHYDLAPQTIVLFWIFTLGSTFAISAGYHRLYSHKTYQTNRLIELLLLAFGAVTFQQSALKWSSLHRSHHQFVDTERDPYNIKKGFFYAHMGWILFYLRNIDYDNSKDLQKNPLVMHQHKHFQLWALGLGVFLPILIGFIYGKPFEAALFGVAGRMFIVFQVTFFINSFAHTFGKKTYDESISARDNWLGAFLTFGEGYHSFHHKYPNDYRNGIKWYHYDPAKWFIWTLSKVGLAKGLRRTPGY